ncbi:MAG: CHAT domain-containing protein [Cytophagales bacterium]|nr:CHAT domain-containing protein [Cytophagales bacterium]
MKIKLTACTVLILSLLYCHAQQSNIGDADMLKTQAELHFKSKNYGKAIELYTKLIAQLNKRDTTPVYIKNRLYITNNLGMCYYLSEKYENAVSTYEQLMGSMSCKSCKMTKEYTSCLNNYASSLVEINSFSKAENVLNEAVRIKASISGKSSLDFAISANNLADLYNNSGKCYEAEQMYKEIISSLEASGEIENITYAVALNNLGETLSDLGSYDMAISCILKSIKVKKALEIQDENSVANSYINLGSLYAKTGKLKDAEATLIQGLKIKNELGYGSSANYGYALHNLAEVYTKMGNYTKAISFTETAIEIVKNKTSATSPQLILLYASLALNYTKANKTALADSIFTANYELIKNQSTDNNSAFANFLGMYADHLFVTGKYDMADKMIYTAIIYKNEEIADIFKYLSEKEKIKLMDKNEAFFRQYLKYCIKRSGKYPGVKIISPNHAISGELMNYRLNNKAIVFQSTQKLKKIIMQSNDSTVIKKYETLEDYKNIISRLHDMVLNADAKLKLKNLEKKANDLEKEIYNNITTLKNQDDEPITEWKRIQDLLNTNEAAIDIIRLKHSKDTVYYFAIILTKNSNYPQIIYFDESLNIEKRYLKYFRNSIKLKEDDLLSYNAFWKPLAANLKGIQKIYFSPDGVYHSLSLNALKNTETNKYLIEELEIHRMNNLKQIEVTKSASIQNEISRNSTFMGRPEYFAKSTANDMQKVQTDLQRSVSSGSLTAIPFTDLPGTETEVSSIHALLQKNNINTSIYLKSNATEENLKNLDAKGILHIATHGYFIPEAGENSKEAMLRSGIVMANINPMAENDGLFTAYELSTLDFTKLKLIVFSACETGLGDVMNGEGVFGLQRAAGIAGAKTVMMSMWTVNDEATKELMITFYGNWLKYNNMRKAFKDAQLAMLAKYKHPYYWAPFVLTGE